MHEGHLANSFGKDAGEAGGFEFLNKPYAMLIGMFLACMVALSFDITIVHNAAMAARWPLLGMMATVGLIYALGNGIGRIHPSTIMLGLLIVIAAASAGWSSDPEYSIQRAGSLVFLHLATLVGIVSYCRRPENARAVFDVVFWIGAGLAIGGFLFRMGVEAAPGGRYVGLHNRATGAGSYAALLLPIAIYQVRYRFKGFLLLVGWITVFALVGQLILSGARMAAGTSLLVGLALWFDFYGRKAVAAIAVLAILAPIPILLDNRQAEKVEERSKKLLRTESIATFTGRLDRWKFGLEKWAERPIYGYGFGVSRTLAGRDEPWRFNIEPGEVFNLHSDQIEVLMDLGLAGYIPFALFWILLGITGLKFVARPRDETRQRGMAVLGAAAYAFGDTFMHGGFLAAGGGVSAFSWSMIGMFFSLAAIPMVSNQTTVRRAAASKDRDLSRVVLVPQPMRRSPADRSSLPSVRQVMAGQGAESSPRSSSIAVYTDRHDC